MKRVFMFGCGGIMALLVLVIAVAIKSGGGSQANSRTGMESQNQNTVSAQVGSPFKLGNFMYTVKGFSRQQSIGNQVVNEAATPGAIFVIVSYSIENQGSETATAMASDFYLLDSSKRKFEPSSRAQTALSMATKSDFIVTQLQPGIVKQAQQVFEVPQQVVDSGSLSLVIPEKGFGSKKAMIPIN